MWLQAVNNGHCLLPVPSTLLWLPKKSGLSPLSTSDQHSKGTHDTQQMSRATEVSEATLFTQVASSTHEGRDTQIYEGSPL